MSAHPSDEDLERRALGDLSAHEAREMAAHLEACAGCAERAAVEDAVDRWVTETALVASPDDTARVLRRFAAERDSADGSARRASVARSIPWMAAAAALLVAWWFVPETRDAAPTRDVPIADGRRDTRIELETRIDIDVDTHGVTDIDVDTDTDTDGDGDGDGDTDPGASHVDALDPLRLAAARELVADVLLEADRLFPFQDESFRGACDDGLLPLRREGWPVLSLLRGAALGDDELCAAAALRLAVLDSSTRRLLAHALERPDRAAQTLALLLERHVPVDGSPALVSALEDLVLAADVPVRVAALTVLARDEGPRAARSLDRLVDALPRGLPTGRRRADAVDDCVALLAQAPLSFAVPAALALVARDAALAPRVTPSLVAACADAPDAAARALRGALDDDRDVERIVEWACAADVRGLVPDLLARLESDASDDRVRAAVVHLGGASAAEGLFLLWREEAGRTARETYGVALRDVLTRDPTLLRHLGASTPDGSLDDLIAFAAVLPAPSRTAPLWAALASDPAGARAGRLEALLAGLGRMGDVTDGRALLAWLAVRPAHDAAAPLVWAAAAALAPCEAEAAFAAAGRDPRPLRAVARVALARFRVDELPSASQLASLRRALEGPDSPPR